MKKCREFRGFRAFRGFRELDGKGAKIKKALSLDLTATELLAVNASVESMVTTITMLEQILQEKVVLVLGDS